MLRLQIGRVQIAFSFWFFAVVGCFAATDGGLLLRYLLPPILVHELGHLLVMALCGVRLRAVGFTVRGIEMRRAPSARAPSDAKELAISLGGVAANAVFALVVHFFFFRSMRMMFLTSANIAVALFNLAPIGDLDGGQILKLLCARRLAPDTARTVARTASFLMLGLLFGLSIFLISIGAFNASLLVACVYLAVNVILRE